MLHLVLLSGHYLYVKYIVYKIYNIVVDLNDNIYININKITDLNINSFDNHNFNNNHALRNIMCFICFFPALTEHVAVNYVVINAILNCGLQIY